MQICREGRGQGFETPGSLCTAATSLLGVNIWLILPTVPPGKKVTR
jgi:hypothetical protein